LLISRRPVKQVFQVAGAMICSAAAILPALPAPQPCRTMTGRALAANQVIRPTSREWESSSQPSSGEVEIKEEKRCHGEESCCDLETQGLNPGAFGRFPRLPKPQPMQQGDLHLSLALPLRGMNPRSKQPIVNTVLPNRVFTLHTMYCTF
jgi:hypothetical protein